MLFAAASYLVFVRCAYSFDLQKLYLNNLAEQNIIPEIFFTTPTAHSNNMSLKFFMNNYVKVVVHGAKDNFTRIFIQTINIFRDYIPQVLNIKYMSMKQYAYTVSSSQYYPLLFAVDFQTPHFPGRGAARHRVLHSRSRPLHLLPVLKKKAQNIG